MFQNFVCVILTAGHNKQLDTDIQNDHTGRYQHLKGIPKALLPGPGGKRILDHWWDVIKTRQLFSKVYLVTNADKYKHFERWATASDFPLENLINDGSTLMENALGAVADFELVLRTKNLWDNNVLVIAGDMLFQDCKFDMSQILDYYHRLPDGNLAIYYEMEKNEPISSRGIVEVCPKSNRILRFLEKPLKKETSSMFASVVFYLFRPETLSLFTTFLSAHPSQQNFGTFMQWLINENKTSVYGLKLPTGFQLIGQVRLEDYESWLQYFSEKAKSLLHGPITCRAYARVGLIGNPSDGFNGKTISLTLSNFWAESTIVESEKLRLIPHPLNDPMEFGSLSDLYGISFKEGYLGGLRLLQATCKKFYHYCAQKGIALAKRNFTLSYDTNIPRQVGLAGSSAIVTATLKCLMTFYNLTALDLQRELQAQFVLDVEKEELHINAGLQDRVVQIYEGLVYMDFSRHLMEKQGFGTYYHLKVPQIPPLFLAYLADPSDSGKIHSDVALRWQNGDEEVSEGMGRLAEITDEAAAVLTSGDWSALAALMNENFNIRRKMYGESALGELNLRLIYIGRSYGAAVKFSGSGGAVVGLLNDPSQMKEMKKQYQSEGFVVIDVIPRPSECNAGCCS